MNINYLRLTAAKSVKFSILVLLLAIATGCNASPNEPEVDEDNAASTSEVTTANAPETDTPTADTSAADTVTEPAADTATEPSDTTPSSQANSPQREPGYVGYPFMGETAAGDPIYYITSESITCADGGSGCVMVRFVQVNADDLNQTADGRAVAQCASQTLTEVVIDEDLVAYEIASPDAAMTNLLNTACQAHRPGEPAPFMGETAAGDPIWYKSGESIPCADGSSGCVMVRFGQGDTYSGSADGQAVAQCARGALTEVVIDGDLVAYEIASPDEAMTNLLNAACRAQ